MKQPGTLEEALVIIADYQTELATLDEQINMRLAAERELAGWRTKSKQWIAALDKMLEAARGEV